MTPNTAIYRRQYRETISFLRAPTPETRKKLAESGFEYRNGQWVKNISEGQQIDEQNITASIG